MWNHISKNQKSLNCLWNSHQLIKLTDVSYHIKFLKIIGKLFRIFVNSIIIDFFMLTVLKEHYSPMKKGCLKIHFPWQQLWKGTQGIFLQSSTWLVQKNGTFCDSTKWGWEKHENLLVLVWRQLSEAELHAEI